MSVAQSCEGLFGATGRSGWQILKKKFNIFSNFFVLGKKKFNFLTQKEISNIFWRTFFFVADLGDIFFLYVSEYSKDLKIPIFPRYFFKTLALSQLRICRPPPCHPQKYPSRHKRCAMYLKDDGRKIQYLISHMGACPKSLSFFKTGQICRVDWN